jgi:hypothetical protein
MAIYLQPDEYMPDAPDEVGATVRVSHDGCGDTRGRLYITRKQDGSGSGRPYVLAYCHNCGLGGRSVPRSFRSSGALRNAGIQVPSAPEVLALPKGVEFDSSRWPYEVQGWLRRYGIDLTSTHPYLAYDPASESLILAAWSSDGLEGYQARSFRKGWDGPKYLTYRKRDAKLPQRVGNVGDLAVICEDTVSALKVAQTGIATGIPMWRAPADSDRLLELSKEYGKIVVWLDNDNPLVRRNALALARRLRAYNRQVEVELGRSDPKHQTDLKDYLLTKRKK